MGAFVDAREFLPLALQLKPSDKEFKRICRLNPDLRLERSAQGELLIMPPASGESGYRNVEVAAPLSRWAKRDGRGVVFDSSTGYRLPNRAIRSPDASWVLRNRLARLTKEQKQDFLPLCPDFAIEVRSGSDRLPALQDKMQEYIDNGAQLGWLIDPYERLVFLYRPGAAVEMLKKPARLSGAPELAGFVLSLAKIWKPDF